MDADDLTQRDFDSSATQQSLDQLSPLLTVLEDRSIESMVDIGCGYGGLTKLIADRVGARDVHGIDLDERRMEVAESRGITTHKLDVESADLPFDEGELDLVTSFGVLEHLKFYDNPIEESNRVLRDDGFALHSIPNLGSWINRIALLLGRQPRDVEISTKRAFGILEFYPDDQFLDHVHSCTYRTFMELLDHYEFEVVESSGLFPYQGDNRAVKLLDTLTAPRIGLCRRVAILGRKRATYTGAETGDRLTTYDEETGKHFVRGG